MTPYYSDDWVTIYHGDCREFLPNLTADLLLTDAPYGEVNRTSQGLRNLDKGNADVELFPTHDIVSLLSCTSAYVWCGTEQVSGIRKAFVEAGWTTRLCVWEKSNPSPMNGEHLWLSSLEVAVFARRKGAVFNGFCESPVFRGSSAQAEGHPTTKPKWLMSTLLAHSSNPNQTVLDPYMGSGSTLRAAKDANRKAIGIEIEERYCEVAARRMAQEVLSF